MHSVSRFGHVVNTAMHVYARQFWDYPLVGNVAGQWSVVSDVAFLLWVYNVFLIVEQRLCML